MNTPKLLNPEVSATTRHLYEVEVSAPASVGYASHVLVNAQNRDQAARIATRHGYNVRSVNMIA